MLKKSLLASIAFMSINPVLASQHMPTPAHAGSAHEGSNCPPCPCGGAQGWVLIPAGPGTPCHQGEGATPSEEEAKPHHHPAPEHHHDAVVHHKPLMHPEGRTPEQQKLEDELQPIIPHIFLRANPHSPTPNKKEGEWGKELHGKIYFRHLGNWVYDPSVKPTDIVSTGVKDKIKKFNAGGPQAAQESSAHAGSAHAASTHTGSAHAGSTTETKAEAAAEAKAEAVVEAKKEAAAETKDEAVVPTAPPLHTASAAVSRGGWTKDAKGRWVKNTPPDALGTTARPNTVDENGRPIQGSFNRAQTGMTGGAAPRIDASANSPAPSGN